MFGYLRLSSIAVNESFNEKGGGSMAEQLTEVAVDPQTLVGLKELLKDLLANEKS